jgi:UMF1 family MFS transporter
MKPDHGNQAPGEREYKRRVHAWYLYDWANSAFATTVMAGMFPPFFRAMAVNAGLGQSEATAYWGYTTAIALALIAPLAPMLGAAADQEGRRKFGLIFFMVLGVVATSTFVFLGPSAWLWASVLFIIANIGFAGGNLFYDALLPHVARPQDLDRVSTTGYAMGYIGGGVLLLINVAWFIKPAWFGIPSADAAIKLSFISVALWWLVFTLPLIRRVAEPPGEAPTGGRRSLVRGSLGRLAETLRHLRRYKQAMLFLIAFLIYNDGIGTIIKMATAYGDEIGIKLDDMILALVITQFVGVPAAFAFGWAARWIGSKRSIMIGLGMYVVICMVALYMKTTTWFYILAIMVGLTQGGTQALSRSLFGSMIPRARSAEFFGFFSTSSKFAGILGPLVFGLVTHWLGDSRLAIATITGFFVIGGVLLAFVDVDAGIRAVKEEEKRAL